jgi:regulator of protease activity HflC (stomatin/prohibitin superfamily)
MLFKRISVGDRERVLVTRNGRFDSILKPGDHVTFTGPFVKIDVETYQVRDLIFTSPWADFLVKERPAVVEANFRVVETADTEVAMIFVNKALYKILAPGKRTLFWRDAAELAVEIVNTADAPEVPKAHLAALERLGPLSLATVAGVEDGRAGLLFLDNRMIRVLQPGKYGFWNAAGTLRVEAMDLRRQSIEVSGQEILTKDKVSIRVNIVAEYQIADPVKAKQSVKDFSARLYGALQLAVRETLGHKTLEEILAAKTDADPAVAATIRAEMQLLGVEVGAVALKDIILPGEMREILNQVVSAEKQAQANLIRRREETAATRSLLNTAKLMEDNPILVRLKELESLEKLVASVGQLTLFGGFDTLLKGP